MSEIAVSSVFGAIGGLPSGSSVEGRADRTGAGVAHVLVGVGAAS